MIEINPKNNFLTIRETLTRIGIASKDNTLTQSCHILCKDNKYYIVHFLELLAMSGKRTTMSLEDIERTYSIACLLQQWKLCTIIGKYDKKPVYNFKVVSYKDKANWTLVKKFNL